MADIQSALPPASSSVRTFGVSWSLLVLLLTILAAAGGEKFNRLLADADTYWHLAAGRWILEHGQVPLADPFSHSMLGAPWTAHEWLSELVLTGVFQVAGWGGLVAFVAILFAGTLAYITRFLLARMEPVHALLFTAFAASMLMGHLLARPHVLAWPLLALWVGTLVNAAEARHNPPWLLLPLMTVWANLHGSFTLALALGGALAVEAVLSHSPETRRVAAGHWAGFIALSILAAMVTPWGWHGLIFPFQLMNMTIALDSIQEWLSPNFHQFQIVELWLLLILAIASLGRLRLPWLRLFLVLGFVHLALKHQRHVAILGLVTPFLIAAPLARQWSASAGKGRDAESLDRIFRALAAPARPVAVVVATLFATLLVGLIVQAERFKPLPFITPEVALQTAMKEGAHGPVLNSYTSGGYLIYREVPVFIDGRADMYGDAFMKRYLAALRLHDSEALPQLLEDYRIGWTLLSPETPALAVLDRLPGWRRVYADEIAVVHVRNVVEAAR